MTVNNHTFPQSGDDDYAENFAAHLGRSNITDYVETGMNFQNASGTSVDLTEGKAFILRESDDTSAGETRLKTDFMVHLPATSVALTDNALNYVYLVPNTGTNDSASATAYTDQTDAGTDDLLIGEVDTNLSTPEVTERNRNPDVEFGRLRSFVDLGIPVYDDVTNAETGEGNVIFATGNGSTTQGMWMYDGSGWMYSGIQSLQDDDVSGITGLLEDTSGNRPTASEEGRLFFETDTQSIYYDTGSSWLRLALDASEITASDLGFDPATQSELDTHAGQAGVHHTKTSTLDELADADVTELVIDTESNQPSPGTSNRVFIARDTGKVFHDTGSSWTLVGVSSHSHLQNVATDDHHTRYTDEEAQDAVDALLSAGNAISLNYDDANNSLSVSVSEGSISHDNLAAISTDDHHTRYSDEEARDTTSAMLSSGSNISLTKDDANDTVTIDTSALNPEEVDDRVNTVLTAGNALGSTYDDANDTLTLSVQETDIDHTNLASVSADDHHAPYTDEKAQDAVNVALNAGTALTKTYDDAANTISLNVDAGNFADSYTVSDGGASVLSDPTDINFGANITVTDDTDGTVTIEGSANNDTHTDVSESGTLVVGSVGDINFSNALNVADDTDGSVTVDVSESDISHDNLGGVSASDHHARPTAGNALADNSGTFDVQETSIDHTNLASVSADDHHTRYADSEAVSAINSADISPTGVVLPVGTDAWV